MCFYINLSHPNAKIAKKPIKCYKIGYLSKRGPKRFVSFYQGFRYKFGKRVNRKLEISGCTIFRGLHSFSKLRNAIEELEDHKSRRLVICRIPRGATYYYDPLEETYVSTSIVVVRERKRGNKW